MEETRPQERDGVSAMNKSSSVTTAQPAARSADFTRDAMLEVLSNRRRRFAIHYLKQRGRDTVTVSELAEQVASWEYDKDIDELTHRERKRVRNALRQFHLSKMAEHGFVEYDSKRGTVELTQAASSANFYVDSLTGGEIPWSVYYLGLSAFSALFLFVTVSGTSLFSFLSPLVYSVFLASALVVSSIGHFYDNYYRMRLGARDTPPEVDEP